MAKAATDTTTVLDVPVEFGGISIQKETSTIGVRALKTKMSPTQAEHFLCGARLEVAMKADPDSSDDVPGQETFDELSTDSFESVGDVKSYRSGPESFGCSVVFNRDEGEKLIQFGQARGRLKARRIGAASDPKDDEE